jgi:electron transfer flavoprotein alpha/beta subunit
MMENIVSVRKNEDGDIAQVKTDQGNVYSVEQAVQLAKNQQLANVVAAHRGDREYIRTKPDGSEGNNLDSMPEF